MKKVEQTIKLVLSLALTFIAILVSYLLSSFIVGQNYTMLTQEETSQAGGGLFLVSLMASQV